MEKLKVLLLGVLIGAVMMISLPSQAHHSRELRRLRNRVAKLEQRTVQLGTDGGYLGDVHGFQVDMPTGAGCDHLDPAVWRDGLGLGC